MSKFNKRKCAKCKYRCTFSGANTGFKVSARNIGCYYGVISNTGTCLHLVNGKIIDRRGDDYDNCKLFEKGNRDPNTYGYS